MRMTGPSRWRRAMFVYLPLVRSNVTDTLQAFVWRSNCLEETEASKCCAVLECYDVDDAIKACVGVDA